MSDGTSSPGSSIHMLPLPTDTDAHPGLGGYSKKRSELLEVLNSLHSAGIQNEVDLPQIVVVGSQSVGKSSLIESMSGIKLPRASGTCTRCPMECRLQNAPYWSCQISLRFSKDPLGKPLHDVQERNFGEKLFDKDRVEQVLRQAQRAILRPNLDFSLFLNNSDLRVPGEALTFSENCVCVHVQGPQVPDLYFYDLPGVIANVGDGGDEQDITLVEALVREYISKSNCIILLVISCETDFENQGAGRLILKDETLRKRTVGVLTKVDRIEAGTSDRWISILKNRSVPLEKGWYAVKQPSQAELRTAVTWEEARQREEAFFTTNEPWRSFENQFKQNLGSRVLAERLSTILSELVVKRLPQIHRDVSRMLHQINREHAKIPPRNFDDPRNEIITLIRDFMKKLSKHIDGLPPRFGQSTPGLIFAINAAYDAMRLEVHRTAPQFRPWKDKMARSLPEASVQAMIMNSVEDDAADGTGIVMYVDEVMDLARRSRTRELPGNYPYAVKETLIREFASTWHDLAKGCFETVEDILTRHVNTILREHFGSYAHGGLLDEVNLIVQNQISRSAASTKLSIESLCRMENQPFTQNEEFFYGCRRKLLARYKTLYHQSLGQTSLIERLQGFARNEVVQEVVDTTFGPAVTAVMSGLATLGIHGCMPSDLALLLTNELDPALEIMAEVRAYFQVAFKRFGDMVPELIDAEFLRAFESSLNIALIGMELSNDRCVRFLEEAPELMDLRTELVGQRNRLEAAKEKLDKLFVSPQRPGVLGESTPEDRTSL